MAHSEAASIVSFLRLARQLAQHGAPAELVARCRDAARDEARHARIMTRIARSHRVRVDRPVHAGESTRSLVSLAEENAAEGCVRETWAALLALEQSRTARDRDVRSAMVTIAVDEARHAELSWELDAWFASRLDAAERRQVAAARARAATELRDATIDAEIGRRDLGLPSRDRARALRSALSAALWS
jgi:hypothetical protein